MGRAVEAACPRRVLDAALVELELAVWPGWDVMGDLSGYVWYRGERGSYLILARLLQPFEAQNHGDWHRYQQTPIYSERI
jgi:hypothetical protein